MTNFLKAMGIKIKWVKKEIKIIGNQKLKPVKHHVMFDRIEAGTFIIAGALSSRKLKILGLETKILKTELGVLKKMGVKMKIGKNEITVLNSKKIKPVFIKTEPYPGFPTDCRPK